MKFHKLAVRELMVAWRSFLASQKRGVRPELIPFVINLPEDIIPMWFGMEKIHTVIREAAVDAVNRLARGQIKPGCLLGHNNVPAELRSQAARSMLAMRGGKATAAKMRKLGYPNLVKAREALKRKSVR
jgi:hypothetical protein